MAFNQEVANLEGFSPYSKGPVHKAWASGRTPSCQVGCKVCWKVLPAAEIQMEEPMYHNQANKPKVLDLPRLVGLSLLGCKVYWINSQEMEGLCRTKETNNKEAGASAIFNVHFYKDQRETSNKETTRFRTP